jgi:hypothetical protein
MTWVRLVPTHVTRLFRKNQDYAKNLGPLSWRETPTNIQEQTLDVWAFAVEISFMLLT